MAKTQFLVVTLLLAAVALMQLAQFARDPEPRRTDASGALTTLGSRIESLERSVRERAETTITVSDNAKDVERIGIALRDIVATELERALSKLPQTNAPDDEKRPERVNENPKGDPQRYTQATTALDQAIASGQWTFENYNEVIGLTTSLSARQRDELAQKFSEAIHTGKLDLDEISKSGVPIAF